MVFSLAEIVTTILDLGGVNNPDRVGDVTDEPFTAPPREMLQCGHRKLGSVVLDRCCKGRELRMQIATQSEGASVAHQ